MAENRGWMNANAWKAVHQRIPCLKAFMPGLYRSNDWPLSGVFSVCLLSVFCMLFVCSQTQEKQTSNTQATHKKHTRSDAATSPVEGACWLIGIRDMEIRLENLWIIPVHVNGKASRSKVSETHNRLQVYFFTEKGIRWGSHLGGWGLHVKIRPSLPFRVNELSAWGGSYFQ